MSKPIQQNTRAGYVAIVGTPNAGKSTFLNAVLKQKLSIVTPKAQTTQRRITGIHSTDQTQFIFLDTPGLLSPKSLLDRAMVGSVLEAVQEADVALILIDGATGKVPDLIHVLDLVKCPKVFAVNKIDTMNATEVERLISEVESDIGGPAVGISAKTQTGVDELLGLLEERLPESPFLYPADQAASQSLRFFASELVRETLFDQYQQEIPYAVHCETEDFREGQKPVYIGVTLYCDRKSQKPIVIGSKGTAIRKLGEVSRKKIEKLVGEPVYLDLWVKVLPGWRRKADHLRQFGFKVPKDAEESDGE